MDRLVSKQHNMNAHCRIKFYYQSGNHETSVHACGIWPQHVSKEHDTVLEPESTGDPKLRHTQLALPSINQLHPSSHKQAAVHLEVSVEHWGGGCTDTAITQYIQGYSQLTIRTTGLEKNSRFEKCNPAMRCLLAP